LKTVSMDRYFYIGILLSFLFIGCQKDDPTPQPEEINRTVLVYLGRDNNLSSSVEEKTRYILEGWNVKNGNLIIYEDLAGKCPTLSEAYQENGVCTTRLIYEAEADENSVSPAVFKRVLTEVKELFPAKSYGLVLFSHGWGWLPEGGYSSPRSRSIILDQTDEMEIWEFAEAIPDKMFEFIVFEACFMAGIEVAYELRNKIDYILASSAEIVSPGFKEVYSQAMDYLFLSSPDLVSFARSAMEVFINTYGGTLSIIRTSGLESLAGFIKNSLKTEREVTLSDIQRFDRNLYSLFFDFEDYYSRIIHQEAVEELPEYIDRCILHKEASSTFM
ncbi:MAG: clostripain-related cysteine peptidase, partial [Bacteroides sp.]|nr:clostripain-related cysteine peptidase [Bacteroides sp.]